MAASPGMCTSSPIQPAAASFDDGANARLAISANSTRSVVSTSRRVPPNSFRIAVPIPSRAHRPSSSHAPPSGRDSQKLSPVPGSAASNGTGASSSRVSDAIQPFDPGPVHVLGAAEVVEHLHPRGLARRIPRVWPAAGTAPWCRPYWSGRAEVERETAEWVRWFNANRLHSSIDYLSPVEYETRYREQHPTVASILEVA